MHVAFSAYIRTETYTRQFKVSQRPLRIQLNAWRYKPGFGGTKKGAGEVPAPVMLVSRNSS